LSANEPHEESLAERMGRGPLPLTEVLGYATQIATCLRDLHMNRLVYGAVSSQLILLGPSGATLRSSVGLIPLGDGHKDVKAFGAVLDEMLHGMDGPEEFREKIGALAMRCQEEAPDMQQVLIALRILGLQARQGPVVARSPAPVRQPAAVAKRDVVRAREIAGPPRRDRLLG
jgi:hypothetical protein